MTDQRLANEDTILAKMVDILAIVHDMEGDMKHTLWSKHGMATNSYM